MRTFVPAPRLVKPTDARNPIEAKRQEKQKEQDDEKTRVIIIEL